jgi:hypothetical protein
VFRREKQYRENRGDRRRADLDRDRDRRDDHGYELSAALPSELPLAISLCIRIRDARSQGEA